MPSLEHCTIYDHIRLQLIQYISGSFEVEKVDFKRFHIWVVTLKCSTQYRIIKGAVSILRSHTVLVAVGFVVHPESVPATGLDVSTEIKYVLSALS